MEPHTNKTRRISRIAISCLFFFIILSVPLWLQPYAVVGGSMFPTLQNGELIFADRLSLALIPPRRGELIVFRNPHKEHTTGEIDVKRVIGLPGETVHVRPDRVVIDRECSVSGELAVPQFAPASAEDGPCQTTYATSTPIGRGGNGDEFDMFLGPLDYFVLGDDRGDSSDSRLFGAVQPENFIGRAALRLFPLTQTRILYGVI